MIKLELFQVGIDLDWNLFGFELNCLALTWVENDPGWNLSGWT